MESQEIQIIYDECKNIPSSFWDQHRETITHGKSYQVIDFITPPNPNLTEEFIEDCRKKICKSVLEDVSFLFKTNL